MGSNYTSIPVTESVREALRERCTACDMTYSELLTRELLDPEENYG